MVYNHDEPTFASWLRARMDERNLTQDELAAEVGISQQTVSRYLSGAYIPRAATLSEICKALAAPIDDAIAAIERGEAAGRRAPEEPHEDELGELRRRVEVLERLVREQGQGPLTNAGDDC